MLKALRSCSPLLFVLAIGAPAHAGMLGRVEDSTLACLEYQSKINCDKAKGSATLLEEYARAAGKARCASIAKGLSYLVGVQSITSDSESRTDLMKVLGTTKKDCAGL